MANNYISLQGEFYLAPIVNGVPGALRHIGNVPEFELELTAEILEHKESMTGQRATDFTLVQTTGVAFTGQLEQVSPENLEYILSGKNHAIVGATVVDQSLGTVVANQLVSLDAYNLSAVTIKDSTPTTPITLDPSKYELDAAFGTVKVTDITGLVMPLKISYTSGAVTNTTIASDFETEYMLYFKGINTINQDKVVVKLWRTKKSPETTFGLIHEELGQYQISGQALADVTKQSDAALGLYGHMVSIPAVAP